MRLTSVVTACVLGISCSTAISVREPIAIPMAEPPRPIQELVQQLGAADAPSRVSAAWGLAGAGEVDGTTARALLAALEDPSEPVREGATWALAHVKSRGIDLGQLMDEPPKALVQGRPDYPHDAFSNKTQGTVLVEVLLNALGQVAHAEIRQSIPGLDHAALAAVRRWQFRPAMRQGRPVSCVIHMPVAFRIY
jgi:TonB family protein